jgi:hypothetical protein
MMTSDDVASVRLHKTGARRNIDDSAVAFHRGPVMDVLVILIAVAALVLFDLAAWRYGADSRGGFDTEQFRIPRG